MDMPAARFFKDAGGAQFELGAVAAHPEERRAGLTESTQIV
jgi:hypothetical protein